MVTIDEFETILSQLLDELPEPFFRELNGGVIIEEESKMSPHAVDDDMYIMGEYCRSTLGRMIKIYYGSFEIICRYFSREELVERMREVLRHEFTHHVESLAGERGLEIKDENQLKAYYESKGRNR